MVNPLSVLMCSIYGDMASAEARAFILLALPQRRAVVKEVVKEVSLCLYRTSRLHLLSTGAPRNLQNITGAQRCGTELIWPLRAPGGFEITSHRPPTTFRIKHKFHLTTLHNMHSQRGLILDCHLHYRAHTRFTCNSSNREE